jgi:hypothetical protein
MKLKVGDKVKVTHKPDFVNKSYDWDNDWVDNRMDQSIGKTFTIVEIELDRYDYNCEHNHGVMLNDVTPDHGFWYPIESIEKVK